MDRVVRSPVWPTLYICLVATHLLYSNEKSYRELHVVETEERNVLCKYCEYKEKQGDLADVLAGDSHSRMCLVLLWLGRDTSSQLFIQISASLDRIMLQEKVTKLS